MPSIIGYLELKYSIITIANASGAIRGGIAVVFIRILRRIIIPTDVFDAGTPYPSQTLLYVCVKVPSAIISDNLFVNLHPFSAKSILSLNTRLHSLHRKYLWWKNRSMTFSSPFDRWMISLYFRGRILVSIVLVLLLQNGQLYLLFAKYDLWTTWYDNSKVSGASNSETTTISDRLSVSVLVGEEQTSWNSCFPNKSPPLYIHIIPPKNEQVNDFLFLILFFHQLLNNTVL